jgi:hypothetical protein
MLDGQITYDIAGNAQGVLAENTTYITKDPLRNTLDHLGGLPAVLPLFYQLSMIALLSVH